MSNGPLESDPIKILLHFDRWATDRIFVACRQLAENDLDREFPIGIGTLRKTLAHLVTSMEWWIDQCHGTFGEFKVNPTSLAIMYQSFQNAWQAIDALIAAGPDSLSEIVVDAFDHPQHGNGTLYFRRSAVLLHLFNHGTHHRVQCLHMLRQLGVQHLPEIDLIDSHQILNRSLVDPTPEMVEFYERRTKEHIDRVRRCLTIVAESQAYADLKESLQERARAHDQSKFGDEERIPYIWLTEYHRCRHLGEAFHYPDGMEEKVRQAVEHHVTTNRHHPEYHSSPNDMSDIDLIEMVCDWTAMAQEFEQDGGSARGWADKNIGSRLVLNADRRELVYRIIELLDHCSLCTVKGSENTKGSETH